ncbi:MAG: lycopene cyclase family protein [Cryomorphaceae bacterium]|nr:hypothetical protein [Flavobacteriales bacterium]
METESPKAPSAVEKHFDYTIVGAGASGLWLAMAMQAEGLTAKKTIRIAERDPAKENDRTWCYWAPQSIGPEGTVSKSWNAIFNPKHHERRDPIAPYTYHHVRSADFYQAARNALKDSPNITWITDEVTNFREENGVVKVTGRSETWTTERIFVSALEAPDANQTARLDSFLGRSKNPGADRFMWQSFSGKRIKSEKPVFDPTAINMMKFDVPQEGHTRFIYVLPFSENEALVELTQFGKERLEGPSADEAIETYMQKQGSAYTVLEDEVAAIPMTARFDMLRSSLPADQKIVYIGTPAGAVKPTTGYAFKRMEAYARDLAKALKNEKPLPTMRRPWRFRLYDHLLLRILYEQPHRGKAIFERLFETQPTTRILKFLDEKTSISEEIAIFSRLPIGLFLGSLVKHLARR